MNFFCDNELCRCHIRCEVSLTVLKYTEANGNEVTTNQFRIIEPNLKREFVFCAQCANVVAKVNGIEQPKE